MNLYFSRKDNDGVWAVYRRVGRNLERVCVVTCGSRGIARLIAKGLNAADGPL